MEGIYNALLPGSVGYADPNFLIPATIEAVSVDGGAFNVREGDNAVDLAATYIPRVRLASFLRADPGRCNGS